MKKSKLQDPQVSVEQLIDQMKELSMYKLINCYLVKRDEYKMAWILRDPNAVYMQIRSNGITHYLQELKDGEFALCDTKAQAIEYAASFVSEDIEELEEQIESLMSQVRDKGEEIAKLKEKLSALNRGTGND